MPSWAPEDSQLAHAGHVDQEPATLEHDQLAPWWCDVPRLCADHPVSERAAPIRALMSVVCHS